MLLRAPSGLARAHALEYLVLTLPRLRGALGPHGGAPHVLLFEAGALVFISALDCAPGEGVRWEGEEQRVVEVPPGTLLCGDVFLYVLHPGAAGTGEEGGEGGLHPHSPPRAPRPRCARAAAHARLPQTPAARRLSHVAAGAGRGKGAGRGH